MRNVHYSSWNMAKNFENVKNEKHILQDIEYGEKQ